MKIKELEPYDYLKLDCFQNLVVTLLQHYQLPVEYLGTMWPWTFQVVPEMDEEDNLLSYHVENAECATSQHIKEIYNADLVTEEIQDGSFVLEKVKKFIDQKVPVIVGIDQFYVPYHYPYIYHKLHGPHSIIVTTYESSKEEVECVDAIPRYKGTIPYSEFEEGVKQKERPWHSILLMPEEEFVLEEERIWNVFLDSVHNVRNNYEAGKYEICYAPAIRKIITSIVNNPEKEKQIYSLKQLCEGVWLWEIGRKPEWLVAYLKTPYVQHNYNKWQEVIELIEANNKDWQLASKFLFMATKKKENSGFLERVLGYFDVIIDREKGIMNLLLKERIA